jgi:hypothetical protein
VSGDWKLQQVRFLLDLSKLHKDDPRVFGDRVDAPPHLKDAYPFLVDAVLNAVYGVGEHLKAEYTRCVASDGTTWDNWYKARLGGAISNERTPLGFMLKKTKGVRHKGTHREPVLLSWTGSRSVRVSELGDQVVWARVDWFFQDVQADGRGESAPDWAKQLARPVDELLEEAYAQLAEYVTEADGLFLDDWACRHGFELESQRSTDGSCAD